MKEKYIEMILSKLEGQLDRSWETIEQSMIDAQEDADPTKKFEFTIGASIKLIPDGNKPMVHTVISYSRKYKDDDGETPIADDQIPIEFDENIEKVTIGDEVVFEKEAEEVPDDVIDPDFEEPVKEELAPEIVIDEKSGEVIEEVELHDQKGNVVSGDVEVAEPEPEPEQESMFESEESQERFEKFSNGPKPTEPVEVPESEPEVDPSA